MLLFTRRIGLQKKSNPSIRNGIIGDSIFNGLRYLSTTTNKKEKAQPHWLVQKIKVYADLSKFRLSSLVVLTTGAGFICAGAPIDVPTMVAACIGTGLCAGSASTMNQVFERDYDALMKRTRSRPLPARDVSPHEALGFGVGMGAAGTSLLFAATNPVVTALGAANIALYAGAYTFSKRHSELNTWIGAVVGAIPPVMGWAAATGGVIASAEPAALGMLLFLWQFPHFFALSWLHREDYARGGFQMVAVNDPSGSRSAGLVMEYSLYLSTLPLLCSATGVTGAMFAVEGMAANAYLVYLAHRFKQDRSNANARRIFLCSLWYLPLLLTGFVLHNRNWQEDAMPMVDPIPELQPTLGSEGLNIDDKEHLSAGDAVSDAMHYTKHALKALCVHEVLVSNPNISQPHLCAKQGIESALEGTKEGVEQSVEAVAALAVQSQSQSEERQ